MKTTSQAAAAVDESEIRALAYELWERAGQPSGRDLEFWQAAERLIADIHMAKEQLPASTPAASGRYAAPPRRSLAPWPVGARRSKNMAGSRA